MEERTVKRRFWNEKLGWYEEREIATGKYKFSEEDKMSIVSEYVTGGRPDAASRNRPHATWAVNENRDSVKAFRDKKHRL